MYRSFEELEVWKRACGVAVRIYQLLKECRDYGIRDQMQRAAVSIASNIAEGAERGGKDFIRFLVIARGSSAELRTQIYIAAKIGIVDKTTMTELVDELLQISKMLAGLIKALKKELEEGAVSNLKRN
ncbi:MAG TPA: four helix bundle protein [Pirellulales bacterium]|nr:four helix bundle protein [Pirellulales bacterium]